MILLLTLFFALLCVPVSGTPGHYQPKKDNLTEPPRAK
jgi:hypothetical protein